MGDTRGALRLPVAAAARNTTAARHAAARPALPAAAEVRITARAPTREPARRRLRRRQVALRQHPQRIHVQGIDGIAAQHEEAVYKDIADARSRLLAAKSPEETIAAANQQTSALGRLLAVVENYPQLKSNEQFNRLMDELAGTENRIAVERMRYNEAVQAYNTSRGQFPSNLTAKMFGFKEYPFFQAPAEAKVAPKVSFSK